MISCVGVDETVLFTLLSVDITWFASLVAGFQTSEGDSGAGGGGLMALRDLDATG